MDCSPRRMRQRVRSDEHGYTLAEMLVALTVVALVSTAFLGTTSRWSRRSPAPLTCRSATCLAACSSGRVARAAMRATNRIALPADHIARVSGLQHFDLLNHPSRAPASPC